MYSYSSLRGDEAAGMGVEVTAVNVGVVDMFADCILVGGGGLHGGVLYGGGLYVGLCFLCSCSCSCSCLCLCLCSCSCPCLCKCFLLMCLVAVVL